MLSPGDIAIRSSHADERLMGLHRARKKNLGDTTMKPPHLLTLVVTVSIKPVTRTCTKRKKERCRSIPKNDRQCQDGTASTARVPGPVSTCERELGSKYVGRRCHCRSTSLTSSLAALEHPKVAILLDELLAVPCNFGGATSLLHTY
jgi:hypothetical protein